MSAKTGLGIVFFLFYELNVVFIDGRNEYKGRGKLCCSVFFLFETRTEHASVASNNGEVAGLVQGGRRLDSCTEISHLMLTEIRSFKRRNETKTDLIDNNRSATFVRLSHMHRYAKVVELLVVFSPIRWCNNSRQ